MSRSQLLQAAVALPLVERAALVAEILESLDDPPDSDVEAAWDAEVERRLQRLDTGQTGTTPASAVFAKARQARP